LKVSREQVAQNKEILRKLVDGQRKTIEHRQDEIDQQKKIYDKRLQQAKGQGEVDLYEARQLNHHKLTEVNYEAEKRLQGIKDELARTQGILADEQKNLTTSHQMRMKDLKQHYSELSQKALEDGTENTKDINHKINTSIKDIEDSTNHELTDIKHKSRETINQSAYEHGQAIQGQQGRMANEMHRLALNHAHQFQRQKQAHEDIIHNQMMHQNRELSERNRIHEDNLKTTQENNKNRIESERKSFEEKMAGLHATQKLALNNLETQLNSELNRLSLDYSRIKAAHQTKIEDQFYRMTLLDPQVTEGEKNYLVSLKIPEHERDLVSININQRKITLQMSRRFNEKVVDQTGDQHSSRRSETLSKSFHVSQILDPASVKQQYNNGILTFDIKKA
jgi:HSP20 family molecular chaperone IbpA